MALGSTVYRLDVEVSDIDAGKYESVSLRTAQHPSEDGPRLVTRMLAYCLLYQEGLHFGPGLGEADEPALYIKDATGQLLEWIDLGHPTAERMHRASKAAQLTIVCHKGVEGLLRERAKRKIYAEERVRVWLVEPKLMTALAEATTTSSSWTVIKTGADLMLNVGEVTLEGSLQQTTLAELSS